MGTSTKLQNSVTGYNIEQTEMIVFSCDFWTVCEELVFLPKLEGEGKRKTLIYIFKMLPAPQLKLFYYEYLTIFCWMKLQWNQISPFFERFTKQANEHGNEVKFIFTKSHLPFLVSTPRQKLSWTPAIQRISLTCETSILHPKMEATQLGFRKGHPWTSLVVHCIKSAWQCRGHRFDPWS